MGQFRIFLIGSPHPHLAEMPAETIGEAGALIAQSRFVEVHLIDVIDDDGVCTDRGALIPTGRIQMLIQEQPA